jgi:hypothetical protein
MLVAYKKAINNKKCLVGVPEDAIAPGRARVKKLLLTIEITIDCIDADDYNIRLINMYVRLPQIPAGFFYQN